MGIIHCAVGIVFEGEHILIARRPIDKMGGGLWEFPGGKIEPKETPQEALIRELKEEVNIEATTIEAFQTIHFDYPECSLVLEVFLVRGYEGTPKGAEGQEITWVHLQDLSNYTFLKANTEIINMLLSGGIQTSSQASLEKGVLH